MPIWRRKKTEEKHAECIAKKSQELIINAEYILGNMVQSINTIFSNWNHDFQGLFCNFPGRGERGNDFSHYRVLI
jgi:hypothetical protein